MPKSSTKHLTYGQLKSFLGTPNPDEGPMLIEAEDGYDSTGDDEDEVPQIHRSRKWRYVIKDDYPAKSLDISWVYELKSSTEDLSDPLTNYHINASTQDLDDAVDIKNHFQFKVDDQDNGDKKQSVSVTWQSDSDDKVEALNYTMQKSEDALRCQFMVFINHLYIANDGCLSTIRFNQFNENKGWPPGVSFQASTDESASSHGNFIISTKKGEPKKIPVNDLIRETLQSCIVTHRYRYADGYLYADGKPNSKKLPDIFIDNKPIAEPTHKQPDESPSSENITVRNAGITISVMALIFIITMNQSSSLSQDEINALRPILKELLNSTTGEEEVLDDSAIRSLIKQIGDTSEVKTIKSAVLDQVSEDKEVTSEELKQAVSAASSIIQQELSKNNVTVSQFNSTELFSKNLTLPASWPGRLMAISKYLSDRFTNNSAVIYSVNNAIIDQLSKNFASIASSESTPTSESIATSKSTPTSKSIPISEKVEEHQEFLEALTNCDAAKKDALVERCQSTLALRGEINKLSELYKAAINEAEVASITYSIESLVSQINSLVSQYKKQITDQPNYFPKEIVKKFAKFEELGSHLKLIQDELQFEHKKASAESLNEFLSKHKERSKKLEGLESHLSNKAHAIEHFYLPLRQFIEGELSLKNAQALNKKIEKLEAGDNPFLYQEEIYKVKDFLGTVIKAFELANSSDSTDTAALEEKIEKIGDLREQLKDSGLFQGEMSESFKSHLGVLVKNLDKRKQTLLEQQQQQQLQQDESSKEENSSSESTAGSDSFNQSLVEVDNGYSGVSESPAGRGLGLPASALLLRKPPNSEEGYFPEIGWHVSAIELYARQITTRKYYGAEGKGRVQGNSSISRSNTFHNPNCSGDMLTTACLFIMIPTLMRNASKMVPDIVSLPINIIYSLLADITDVANNKEAPGKSWLGFFRTDTSQKIDASERRSGFNL